MFTFLNQDFGENGADTFTGVASFGIHKDGDVAYVVILERGSLKVAMLSADVTPSVEDLTVAKVAALMADIATFAAKLPATDGGGLRPQTAPNNQADCSVSTAKRLLASVVHVAGGVIIVGGVIVAGWGAVAVVGAAMEIGALAGLVASPVVIAGAGIGALGYSAITASWRLRIVRDELNCSDLGPWSGEAENSPSPPRLSDEEENPGCG